MALGAHGACAALKSKGKTEYNPVTIWEDFLPPKRILERAFWLNEGYKAILGDTTLH